jgi:alkanesulfonate monooxygenase SsuD/methylene tetrahydromethanopterin reductase-like flavin-dependent oxidoreductase (luciferase family)
MAIRAITRLSTTRSEYWQGLARLAERGKLDGIFLADIVSVYDVYRGGPAPSIVDAVRRLSPGGEWIRTISSAIRSHRRRGDPA